MAEYSGWLDVVSQLLMSMLWQHCNNFNHLSTNTCMLDTCLVWSLQCQVLRVQPCKSWKDSIPGCLVSSRVYLRPEQCCNAQKHHKMAPLGNSCCVSFPSCDVYSKHSLVKCLWKKEESLLLGRKNTSDDTALAPSWGLVCRVKLWLLSSTSELWALGADVPMYIRRKHILDTRTHTFCLYRGTMWFRSFSQLAYAFLLLLSSALFLLLHFFVRISGLHGKLTHKTFWKGKSRLGELTMLSPWGQLEIRSKGKVRAEIGSAGKED